MVVSPAGHAAVVLNAIPLGPDCRAATGRKEKRARLVHLSLEKFNEKHYGKIA